MASLLQPGSACNINLKPLDHEIREGDWAAYQLHLNRNGGKDDAVDDNALTSYRRECALAYLGKRAQLRGGVCSKTQSHVFTPRFLLELDATNRTRRFSRYPWLEKLLDLIAEIECQQADVSSPGNVISLIGASK